MSLASGPVLDVTSLRRTAFWLARSADENQLQVHWAVAVDPELAPISEVESVLRMFRANYTWDLVILKEEPHGETAAEIARDFRPAKGEICAYMRPDTILTTDVLPTVLLEVEKNFTSVVVPQARVIEPETLLTLDLYGSGFNPSAAKTSPYAFANADAAALAAWDPTTSYPGDPELEISTVVYLQSRQSSPRRLYSSQEYRPSREAL